MEAIYHEDDRPERWSGYAEDNARFFGEPPPGQSAPLGSPGGATRLGNLAVDTPLVAGCPQPERP